MRGYNHIYYIYLGIISEQLKRLTKAREQTITTKITCDQNKKDIIIVYKLLYSHMNTATIKAE